MTPITPIEIVNESARDFSRAQHRAMRARESRDAAIRSAHAVQRLHRQIVEAAR